SDSTAATTSASVAFITGLRLVFWLQPATSALRLSGYASGTVRSFSNSTASARASSGSRSRMRCLARAVGTVGAQDGQQHDDHRARAREGPRLAVLPFQSNPP